MLWRRSSRWASGLYRDCGGGRGAVFVFPGSSHRRHEMQSRLQRLDPEMIRQETHEKQQRQEIEALKTDPSYVERTARNKLNLAKPTEVIFRFESTPPASLPLPPR